MANTKITELTALTQCAATDVLPIVKVSANTTKKVSISDLLRNAPAGTAGAPGIANADDQDTGILFPAANSVAVSTGGTQRLVIDSSGNVGIGNSSPSRTLDILGGFNTARIQRSGGANDVNLELISGAGTNYLFTSNDAGNLIVKKNGAERLRIDSSGNVGIGTSSPTVLLDLESTSPTIRLTDSDATGTPECQISGAGGDLVLEADRDNEKSDSLIRFAVDGSEKVRIDGSGNIGVGTTSPSSQLTISNATAPTLTLIDTSFTCTSIFASGNTEGRVGTSSNHDFVFRTNNSERMRIDTSGRLLVGDSSSKGSNRKLQVAATDSSAGLELTRYTTGANSAPSLTLSRSNSDTLGANTLLDSGDAVGYVQFKAANGSAYNTAAQIFAEIDGTPNVNDMPGRMILATTADGASSPTERMRIDSSGRVGIGTTATQQTLTIDVNDSGTTQASFNGINIANTNTTANNGSAITFGQTVAGNSNARIGVIQTARGPSESQEMFFGLLGSGSYSERMRIDSSGNIGIGTSSPTQKLDIRGSVYVGTSIGIDTTSPNYSLHLNKSGSTAVYQQFTNGAVGTGSSDGLLIGINASGDALIYQQDSKHMRFGTANAERMRLNSSGTLQIGGTADLGSQRLQVHGENNGTADLIIANSVANTGQTATLTFAPANNITGARVVAVSEEDFSTGANRTARMEFHTRKDGTLSEKMRITSDGNLLVGRTAAYNSSPGEVAVFQGSKHGVVIFQAANANYTCLNLRNTYANFGGNNVSGNMITFHDQGGTERGKIAIDGSSTSYITSSDYRLKENVIDINDGITRVKQLQPKRFNFIVDANTTVDGFLAHEAQTVVPEAITGTHNEVDDNNNPVYQGIDQSKLVPLLTAALKEAIAKIETLETKVAALEAQ